MFSLFGLICDVLSCIWTWAGKFTYVIFFVLYFAVQLFVLLVVVSLVEQGIVIGAEKLGYEKIANTLRDYCVVEFNVSEKNIVDSVKERKQMEDYSFGLNYNVTVKNPFYKVETEEAKESDKKQ